MLQHMRTSINLPDALVGAAKARATAEHRTVTSLVEEGLRIVLGREERQPIDDALPAYGEVGDRFLVDPRDREALWRVLDQGEPR